MTAPEPLFLAGWLGRLLAVRWQARSAPAGCAPLVVSPFAEEVFRGRPMMARAAVDYGTRHGPALLVDLYGTSDSEDDFRDATVTRWRHDLRSATEWLDELAARAVAREQGYVEVAGYDLSERLVRRFNELVLAAPRDGAVVQAAGGASGRRRQASCTAAIHAWRKYTE